MIAPTQLWTRLVEGCLQRRVNRDGFLHLANKLEVRSPLSGPKLAAVLLSRQTAQEHATDPLILAYIEELMNSGRINGYDVLAFLFSQSQHKSPTIANGSKTSKRDPEARDVLPVQVGVSVLEQLSKGYMARRLPTSQTEVKRSLVVISEWLERFNEILVADLVDLSGAAQQSNPTADALGLLTLAMLESPKVSGVVAAAFPKDAHNRLSHILTSFISSWTQSSPNHAAHITRLQQAQRALRLVVEPKPSSAVDETALAVAAAVQLQAVLDLPAVNSRAATFIFLHSLLSGCPNVDETLLLGFLQNRSKGNIQEIVTSLIAACFDVLAAAMDRRASVDSMFILRSFLINKVPVILSTLTPLMFAASTTPVFCIGQALNHVDANVFPPPSAGIMTSSPLPDTRQEFLLACALHSLIQVPDVEALLGEPPTAEVPPPDRRHLKHSLLQQCMSNSERVVQLLEGLDALDGNSGAIALTISELLRNACNAKDTIFLKSTCSSLCAKPHCLDTLLLFTNSQSLLRPLCQLLDNWTYDDDQGEYQPVYEEFASVFLLVTAMIARFDIDPASLRLGNDSFVQQYLTRGHRSIRVDDMTEEQNKHLSSWAKGLFDPDGITDEVTSSCRPQQFYLLVPTLFEQSVWACAEGVLNPDTLKNGLEYLLEPFLLPSLIGGLKWISQFGRHKPLNQQNVIMTILQHVTKTPSTANDAEAMHQTVLSVVAQPLSKYLNVFSGKLDKQTEIAALQVNLEPYLTYSRAPVGLDHDIKQAISTAGSLQQAMKASVNSLGTWSLSATMQSMQSPPTDSRVHLMSACVRILGTKSVLRLLLDEIKFPSANADGSASVLVDTAAAIVLSLSITDTDAGNEWSQPSEGVHMNPRQALKLEFDEAADTLKTDQLLAEAIVHLHRRVDLLAATPVAPLIDQTLSAMIPDFEQNAAAAAGDITQPMDLVNVGLDMTATEVSHISLGLGGADDHGLDLLGGHGGLGDVNDDDVFAGLNLDGDLDLGY